MTLRSEMMTDAANQLISAAMAVELLADALRAIGGCELESNRVDISAWQIYEAAKSIRIKLMDDARVTVQP